jgi:hypothetical protein
LRQLDGESECARELGASRPLRRPRYEFEVPPEVSWTLVEREEEPEPLSIELTAESERARELGANRPLGRSLKLLDCEQAANVSAPASVEIASNLFFIGHLLLSIFYDRGLDRRF